MNDLVFSGHQPNFLPYMGFFYKMFQSDIFVLDDDVQFTRTGFQNYNFLKINGTKTKITIPVSYDFGCNINEVLLVDGDYWKQKLLRTIMYSYQKARNFETGYRFIEKYISKGYKFLSEMNIDMIYEISEKFGISSQILIASQDIPTPLRNNGRNIYQCSHLGCNVYYSGEGGREYNDELAYLENGIKLIYSDYQPCVYTQTKGDFIENLSVLDYIFNEGFVLPKDWRRMNED